MKAMNVFRLDDWNDGFDVLIRRQGKPSPELTCLNDEHGDHIQILMDMASNDLTLAKRRLGAILCANRKSGDTLALPQCDSV